MLPFVERRREPKNIYVFAHLCKKKMTFRKDKPEINKNDYLQGLGQGGENGGMGLGE